MGAGAAGAAAVCARGRAAGMAGVIPAVGAFSRLKTYRKLDAIRTRGLPKVYLHVALSVLVMNAAAVVNAVEGMSVRRCAA